MGTKQGWMRAAILAAFVFGAGLGAAACGDLEAALLEEECVDDSDCGSKLDCVTANPMGITDSEPVNALQIGWCLDQPSCIAGAQPFCACGSDPNGNPVCTSPSDTNRVIKATVPCQNPDTPQECWCVPPSSDPATSNCPFDEP